MKSWAWSGCRVTTWGETTSRLTVGVTNCETGCSQPTIAAAADTTATAASVPALSRARRRANLCRKVMACARSRGEERVYVGGPAHQLPGHRRADHVLEGLSFAALRCDGLGRDD